jgi:YD repeat-containing protein
LRIGEDKILHELCQGINCLHRCSPSACTNNATTSGNRGKGRLTSITDQSGSTAFVYDALGRVITNTRVIAGKSYVTAYVYNLAGRVTTILTEIRFTSKLFIVKLCHNCSH